MLRLETYDQLVKEKNELVGKYREILGIRESFQQFIPAVRDAVLVQLAVEIGQLEVKIEVKEAIRRDGIVRRKYVQKHFPFYWECDINEDEVPF